MTDWNRLPYPLSFKVQLMQLGLNRVQEGGTVPEMRFLVCTAMTALLRFAASIMLADYIRREAHDRKIKSYIAERLAKPSDTQWLRIVEALAGATPLHAAAQKVATIVVRKSEASSRFQKLIAYRNEVAHGKGPAPMEERPMADAVLKLYEMFAWLGEWDLIVDLGQSHYRCCGEVPALLGTPGHLHTDLHGQPVLRHSTAPGEPMLSLWPFLHFSPRDSGEGDVLNWDEMFLYNSLEQRSHRLNLIGYRYPRQVDHAATGIRSEDLKYRDFIRKMNEIFLTAPLAQDVPDYRERCKYHEPWFVGREDIFHEIANFVNDDSQQYAVLRALPGMGKTALISRLFLMNEPSPESGDTDNTAGSPKAVNYVWHFCSGLDGLDDPYVFLRSIVAQIGRIYLTDVQVQEYLDTNIERLVLKYLQLLHHVQESHLQGNRKLILVLDGLDEALAQRRSDLNIPGLIPPVQLHDKVSGKTVSWPLPRNMKVIFSYRVTTPETHEGNIESGITWNSTVEAALQHLPQTPVSLSGDRPMGGLTLNDVQCVVERARRAAISRGINQPPMIPPVLDAIWNGAVDSLGT